MPRLKAQYREQAMPVLMERLEFKNPMQVPRFFKVVVNMGVSEAKENIQALDQAKEDLTAITGQAPQIRRAKKSISNFKLRQGMPIGLRVTLRGDRMYEFLDRLVTTAIPRLRDFRGLDPKGFDGFGNYNLGLKEQHVFPEVTTEKALKARGMNISIVTSAGNDERALELLRVMGFPFKKDQKK
ncbi:MAG: 50S ribosomal protein L5 [Elusimicrobia bacterium]|nr:50S ribosomal protein L5 [Elusimicrobiota bacterium]